MESRSIDFAKTASIDMMALNNKVVNMRQDVKRAKVQVINKLCKQIRDLKKKKGTDEQKTKNLQKAERLIEEIDSMKKLKDDKVSKYAMANTSLSEEIFKATLKAGPRALARLSDHPLVVKKVKEFRQQHQDWRDLAAYLLVKQTGRRFKTKKQKQIQLAQSVENIQASETMTKAYIHERFGEEGLKKAEQRFEWKRKRQKLVPKQGGDRESDQEGEDGKDKVSGGEEMQLGPSRLKGNVEESDNTDEERDEKEEEEEEEEEESPDLKKVLSNKTKNEIASTSGDNEGLSDNGDDEEDGEGDEEKDKDIEEEASSGEVEDVEEDDSSGEVEGVEEDDSEEEDKDDSEEENDEDDGSESDGVEEEEEPQIMKKSEKKKASTLSVSGNVKSNSKKLKEKPLSRKSRASESVVKEFNLEDIAGDEIDSSDNDDSSVGAVDSSAGDSSGTDDEDSGDDDSDNDTERVGTSNKMLVTPSNTSSSNKNAIKQKGKEKGTDVPDVLLRKGTVKKFKKDPFFEASGGEESEDLSEGEVDEHTADGQTSQAQYGSESSDVHTSRDFSSMFHNPWSDDEEEKTFTHRRGGRGRGGGMRGRGGERGRGWGGGERGRGWGGGERGRGWGGGERGRGWGGGMRGRGGGGGYRGRGDFHNNRGKSYGSDGSSSFQRDGKFENERGMKRKWNDGPDRGRGGRGRQTSANGRDSGAMWEKPREKGFGDNKPHKSFPSAEAKNETKEKLHPSWEASKKRRAEQSGLVAFQGKKKTFEDD